MPTLEWLVFEACPFCNAWTFPLDILDVCIFLGHNWRDAFLKTTLGYWKVDDERADIT